MTFKIGDLVVLKSGGPVMTVMYTSSSVQGQINCIWFSAKGNVKSGIFHELALDYSCGGAES